MTKKYVFQVPNMHCGSCEKKIRVALEKLEGLELDFKIPEREIEVQFESENYSGLVLKKTIEEAGFSVAKMEVKA